MEYGYFKLAWLKILCHRQHLHYDQQIRHILIIARLIILLLVTTRTGLHALMPPKHVSFVILCIYNICWTHSCLTPPPEYSVSSDWSAHTCLSQNR